MGNPDGGTNASAPASRLPSIADADNNTIAELKDKLNDIRHLLANEDIADIKEIEEIAQMVERTSKKITDIEEFRVQNPGRVVRHISFASVSESDMNNMGVSTIQVVKGEDFSRFLTEACDAIMHPAFKSDFDRLLVLPKLRLSLTKYNTHPDTLDEIGSRILVNKWLLELTDICSQLRIHLSLQPKLRFCGTDSPARVDHQNHTTLLTHHPDYGAKDHEARNKAYAKGELRTIGIDRRYSDAKEVVLVLEAMGQKVDLDKFVPQAIARCFALSESMDQKGQSQITFCLTNGRRWVFAAVDRVSGVCIRTSEMAMDLLKDPPSKIMRPLFYWSTIRSRHVHIKLGEYVL